MIEHIWREKDGKVIHDGDCRFWGRPNICTCGLLLFFSRGEGFHGSLSNNSSQYPNLADNLAKHDHALDHAFRNPPPSSGTYERKRSI